MEITFERLVGKVMLIGFTYYSKDNEFVGQKQFWGKVVSANEDGILVEQKNGENLGLPPDLRSVQIAPPGEYTLHSTGEVVVNPDFLTTWSVTLNDE